MLMWLLNATTEKQRKGLADYFSPTVPISRVSGGGNGTFGSDNAFSQETLIQLGAGATSIHLTESNKARGDSGLAEDGSESAETEQAFQKITQALMGRGGESEVTEELLKHIVTRVTDEGLVIEVFANPGAPLFEAGGTRPTPLMRDVLRMIVRQVRPVKNDLAIEGHLRSHPVVLADNPAWDLSTARAHRTREIFEAGGMAPERIRRVTGHADRETVARDPMSVRNNRVEIILLRN
ncbi:MAG: OmpA/MotB family protein, partial [Ruegeria sp.]